MISAEAPVFFAKACEMFILDLTTRAFMHTQDNKRKTLQVIIIILFSV
jgi:nuclear transcription factor Y gamma